MKRGLYLAPFDELADPRLLADGPFDLVVEVAPGADVRPWEAAGATDAGP